MNETHDSKKISVLLPTRKRPKQCSHALFNLLDLAHDPDRIEVVLKLDTDDCENYNDVLKNFHKTVTAVITDRGNGYNDNHKYLNASAKRASGEILMTYADDVVMKTGGWDEMMLSCPVPKHGVYVFRCIVFLGETGDCGIFPITISRKMYELMGCISEHPHADSYINEMANNLCAIDLPMEIYHRRFDLTGEEELNDETFKNGPLFVSLPLEFHGGKKWEVERDKKRDLLKEHIESFGPIYGLGVSGNVLPISIPHVPG